MQEESVGQSKPELSVVVLCFQAGEGVREFIRELRQELERLQVAWELILVGNYFAGHTDPTPLVLQSLAAEDPKRIKVVAKEKQGMMGWDVRSGLAAAQGRYIAFIDGDGQMPASDIAILYRRIAAGDADVVTTYRTKRSDGLLRKIMTWGYNWTFSVLFPGLGVRDVNAKPKMFTRAVYERLRLTSDDWFIDAEIMIKARRYGLRLGEVPTIFYKNLQRKSYVRYSAIFEFIKNLARARCKEFAWQLRQQEFSHSVLLPLAAGLAVRLAVFIPWYLTVGAQQWLINPGFTQPFFYQLGQHLARFGAFSLSETAPFTPNTFHVPLYPAFVAAVSLLTSSVAVLLLAHIAVSMLAFYLFYRLLLLIWGWRAAYWSLWLFVLEPFAVYQSGVFYSEMLFLVFFFAALIFFFKYVLRFRESQHFSSPLWERSLRFGAGEVADFADNRTSVTSPSLRPSSPKSERKNKTPDVRGSSGRLSYVVWCGVFLGLAVLTRPVAQFSIVIFVAGAIIAVLLQRRPLRHLLLAPGIVAVSMLLIISPWLGRNYYHYRTVQLSFLSGYTFYLYNVGDFLASKAAAFNSTTGRDELRNRLRAEFLQSIHDPVINRIDEDVSPLIRHTNAFYKRGFELIGSDWPGYLKYQAIFTASAMLNEGYRDILNAAGIRGFEQSHYLTKLLKPDRLQPPASTDSNHVANAALLVAEILWIGVYMLIAVGLVRLLVRRDWQNFFISVFFLLLVVYFNTAAGSLSSGRYHFPSVPFIIALGVYSIGLSDFVFSPPHEGEIKRGSRTSPNPSSRGGENNQMRKSFTNLNSHGYKS